MQFDQSSGANSLACSAARAVALPLCGARAQAMPADGYLGPGVGCAAVPVSNHRQEKFLVAEFRSATSQDCAGNPTATFGSNIVALREN